MSFSLTRKSLIISLTLAMAFVIISSAVAQDAKKMTDWYQWRGPDRTGISNETGWTDTFPAEGPKQLWKASLGKGFSTVSVSKGKVYTMGNIDKRDFVYCINADTGETIWKYSYRCVGEGGGYPGPSSTPTVDGNRIYTLSREGDFFCFDADTGKVIWYKDVKKEYGAKPPSWQFTSSPLIYDNMVIVDVGVSVALNKKNGELVWKTEDYGGGYASIYAYKLSDSPRLAVFNGYGLVILEPKTGKELGKLEWGPDNDVNATTPIVYDNKVFISSGYGVGCALVDISNDSPSAIYENKNMKNHFNSSVLFDGYLYGFDENQLRCLDFSTGEVKWTQRGLGKSSLMIADGKMIILTEKGELVTAEVTPEAYKEISRAKILDGLCWTVPVLSGGKLYCRNHDGKLLCLDVKAK